MFLRIPSPLRGKKFVAVLPDGVYSAQAESTMVEIPFSTRAVGIVPVFVAGEDGGMAALGYSSGAASSIGITSFSLPAALVAGKIALAQANVSASSYPAEITLDFLFGSQHGQIVEKLKAPRTLWS